MFSKIKFWLECSRWYALPVSVCSWLVVFVYGLKNNGNIFYGILSLVGICSAHLAANLFDDVMDFYKNKGVFPNNEWRNKCKYLFNKSLSLNFAIGIIVIYSLIALLTGCFLFFASGKYIALFMGMSALIIGLYPFLSYTGLSEAAVALCYGLFSGVFYAMTGTLSADSLILMIPVVIFTVNLLYTDTFLDKNIDIKEGKKTLVIFLKNNVTALNFQKCLLIFGFGTVALVYIFDIADWKIFLTYITIPLAVDLINSLEQYGKTQSSVPQKKWSLFHSDYNFEAYMPGIYRARNLMVYFSLVYAFVLYLC